MAGRATLTNAKSREVMTEEKDPAVVMRQTYCKHVLIKSYGQTLCVHCGVSQAELEAMAPGLSLGFPYSGGIP